MEGEMELFTGKMELMGSVERGERRNPEDKLLDRALEILKNPPRIDKYGRVIAKELTYVDALNMAQEEMPEEATLLIAKMKAMRPKN
jgi:hypothetical protein